MTNVMNDCSEFDTNNYATSEEKKALKEICFSFDKGFYSNGVFTLRIAQLEYLGNRFLVSRDEDYGFADRELWEFQDFDSALEFLRDNLCSVSDVVLTWNWIA